MRRNLALIIAGLLATIAATAYVTTSRPRTREQAHAGTAAAAPEFAPEQLDNLVAPVALYPDALLGQVLVACTYPLEVVEAQQWLGRNGELHDRALVDAARQQNWDPSVQALVVFPDALAKLNQDTHWTTELGNAYLAQPADVMAAVQRMRSRAQSAGKLESTAEQKVVVEHKAEWTVTIEIQPANPQLLYVPVYDPVWVWGPAVWGYYPALVYPAVGWVFEPAIPVGVFFDGWVGWDGWGWYPDWYADAVYVNPPFFAQYGFAPVLGGLHGPGAWAHNPVHRMGVPYANNAVARRVGAPAAQGGGARAGGQGAAHAPAAQGGAARMGGQGAARAPAATGGAARMGGQGAAQAPAQGGAARTGGQGAAHAPAAQGGGARMGGQGAAHAPAATANHAGMGGAAGTRSAGAVGSANRAMGPSGGGMQAQHFQNQARMGSGSAARTAPRATSSQFGGRPAMQNYQGGAGPRSSGSAQRFQGARQSSAARMPRAAGGSAGRSFASGRRR